jgi:predicted RNase H-like HicB family nuclease
MKSIVQFNISREDGVYTADGVNAPIATEGATFEELQENIRDAVALYFEGDDPASLGFERIPAILTNFEVSQPLHAGRT